jgi:hypothetical protein
VSKLKLTVLHELEMFGIILINIYHLNIHDKASSKSFMTFGIAQPVFKHTCIYFLLTVHLYLHISVHFNKLAVTFVVIYKAVQCSTPPLPESVLKALIVLVHEYPVLRQLAHLFIDIVAKISTCLGKEIFGLLSLLLL